MGNMLFNIIRISSNTLPNSLNPVTYEWLTFHAVETGLPLVKVQRLWIRFRQLGCDDNGLWTEEIASRSPGKIVKESLQRKILTCLQSSSQQPLTFFQFINASIWLERSSLKDKLRGCFALINNGNPITIESTTDTLTATFPSKSKEQIQLIVSLLFSVLAQDNATSTLKEISEDDFVAFVETQVPRQQLEEMLSFSIYPHLIPAPNNNKVTQGPGMNLDFFPSNSTIPTDKQLSDISVAIGSRDYKELAGRLGILQYDLNHLENIHRGNREKTVFSILREWKIKEGSRAFVSVLKRALYLSGFKDVFDMIEFG